MVALIEESFMDWFVAFRDPADIWRENPSFLCGEILISVGALLNLMHALKNGGRYPWIWLACILHGFTVEGVSYLLPDIDNFWHFQGTVMFIGKRLPLYIILLYPAIIYTSMAAMARLRLGLLAESMAVGLGAVLIDLPYDINGVKNLWWTWHDTDPNIYDRHYWVPWTSYYFHASFAAGFCFVFHGSHRLLSSAHKFQADGFFTELTCAMLTGLFAMPLGVLQFIPIYHPLHDSLKIHSEVCVVAFLGFYALCVWSADRQASKDARPASQKGWFDILTVTVVMHFSFFVLLVVNARPEEVRSTGLHEPIGDCSSMSEVLTAFGQVIPKRTFLCVSDYDEGYFNFDCLKSIPSNGSEWYTICGLPFQNHAEYILVVCMECFLGVFIYLNVLYSGGKQITPPKIALKSRGKRD